MMRWLIYIKKLLFWAIILVTMIFVYSYKNVLTDAFISHGREITLLIFFNTALTLLQVKNFLNLLEKPFKQPFPQTVAAWATSALTNYIAPLQAGVAIRIAYFKQYGITMVDSSTTTLRQLQLSIWAAVGLTGLALMFTADKSLHMMGIAFMSIFVFWPFIMRLSRTTLLPHLLQNRLTTNNYQAFAHALRMPRYRYLIFAFAQYLIVALAVFIVYRSFGADIAIHESLLVSVLTAITGLLALTPNNLGIQEILLGVVANMQGLPVEDAVSIAALFRMGHVINSVALAGTGLVIYGKGKKLKVE